MFAEKINTNKGGTDPGSEALSADRQTIQRKLSVGSSNAPQEQEADTMADTVMRMPERGWVQRKCADCEKEEQLQRKPSGDGQPAVSDRAAGAIQSSAGRGSPLDGNTQSFMSSRMGSDFGAVKIHTDGEAVQLSRELNAKAFTVGKDIYFNEGQYQPDIESGRHLLAHELTHTVQQTGSSPVVQKKDAAPDKLESDKQGILDALNKNDAPIFLSRLRALDIAGATSLLADTAFWQEIKKKFHGSALWSAFTILFFHGKMSLAQRMLSLALSFKKINDAMDSVAIIMAEEGIVNQQYWDVLEEVVLTVFDGDPKLPELFRMLIFRGDNTVPAPKNLSFSSKEVHYEKDETSGTYNLTLYPGQPTLTAYATRQELRVIVRVRFVDGLNPTEPFTFNGPGESGFLEQWKAKIEELWNNKFELTNGVNTLKFTATPQWTFESGHEDKTVRVLRDRSLKCPGLSQAGRANETCWFADSQTDPVVIAHEFGHYLGANDEYALPGSVAEIPADKRSQMSAAELALTTKEGIEGKALPARDGGYTIETLMGAHKKSTEVKSRHISLLINAFNATLPPGTPPYAPK